MATNLLTLTRNELLVTLQIMGAATMNGLGEDPFAGMSERDVEERMNSGMETLLQRGLVEAQPDNTLVLKDLLVAYVGSCVIPDCALLVTEVDAAGTSRPHYFNATEHLLIEHSAPRAGIHEFTQYTASEDIDARLQTLLGKVFVLPAAEPAVHYTTSDNMMSEVLKAARSENTAQASQLLVNAQWTSEHATAFAQDVAAGAVWTGILAQNLRNPDNITSSTTMAVAAPERCWVMETSSSEADKLEVNTVAGPACEKKFLALMGPLKQAALVKNEK